MKIRNTLSNMLVLAAMAAALLLLSAGMGGRADARESEQKVRPGYGRTTGLVGVTLNQTTRLTVWNKGDEPVLARLQFVDAQGKVLILCNEIIQPGKAATEDFLIPDGTSHRVELQAQFGTNEAKLLGLLVPTLQVIDNATGANSWMIGQDGFAEFRPIWVPSLVPPF